MAKRKQRKSSRARQARPLALDFQIRHALEEADELIDEENWTGARRVLEPLLRRAPANLEAMEALSYVYFQHVDWPSYIDLAERIRERTPDRADLYLSLADAETNATFLMLAMRHLRAFVVRFPRHPEHAATVERLQKLQEVASELLTQIRTDEGLPLEGEAAVQFLQGHEWLQVQFSAGHAEKAQELGEALLKQIPEWPPVLNNLSLALGMQGRHAEALAYAERTLAVRPDDRFAASERIKRLFLLGRTEEARTAAAHATEVVFHSKRDDAAVKLAEALALLGDDAGIISLKRRAELAGRPQQPERRAIFLSLVGAAQARLGDIDAARRLWEQALVDAPGYYVAEESLADLQQPAAERHGPFFFQPIPWYSRRWVSDLAELVRTLKDEAKAQSAGRRFLAERPGLLPLLPILLDRGDASARQFALTVCQLAATPETLAALRDFALGQRGTDEQRIDAMSEIMNSPLLIRGKTQVWRDGQWTEVSPIGFEIIREPLRHHSPHIERLAERAVTALNRKDVATAEPALAAALAEEPDAPEFLYNLAVLRGLQGREEEAEVIVKDLRERFPDYSFAIFHVAQRLLTERKPQQALDLLAPVIRRERLHLTEFTMLCFLQIHAFVALAQFDDARDWFQMLARQVPEHPLVAALRPAFNDNVWSGQSRQFGH